jgi:hypothetical protein
MAEAWDYQRLDSIGDAAAERFLGVRLKPDADRVTLRDDRGVEEALCREAGHDDPWPCGLLRRGMRYEP